MKYFLLSILFVLMSSEFSQAQSLRDLYARQTRTATPGYGLPGCEGENLYWCTEAIRNTGLRASSIVRVEVHVEVDLTYACGSSGGSICKDAHVYLKLKNGKIRYTKVYDVISDGGDLK